MTAQITRPCLVCGNIQTPFMQQDGTPIAMTAHEFKCYKTDTTKVPPMLWDEFRSTRLWEERSNRAKAAAVKRKANAAAKLEIANGPR